MASYIVTDRIRVNIIHSFAVPPRVKCEQYDGDYTKLIQAVVYNGDVLYTIPSAVRRVVVSGLKPDGNGFSYDCTWGGTTVNFSLMKQMTAVHGDVPCNITMFDASNNQISSAVFVLDVEKAALPSEDFVSSNDFQTFIDYVQAANLYAQYSKSYAVGNTGVRANEDADNSKYYAHLAKMFKGSPLTASTISEMVDIERTYVYVGNESGYNNGHWYFYNDTTWEDGGVYNSEGIQTDKDLLIEDVAADAKAVGDAIRGLTQDLTTAFATPQMFGAKGNGVHDDTNAFIALAHEKNVVIPEGSYVINSEVVLDNVITDNGSYSNYMPMYSKKLELPLDALSIIKNNVPLNSAGEYDESIVRIGDKYYVITNETQNNTNGIIEYDENFNILTHVSSPKTTVGTCNSCSTDGVYLYIDYDNHYHRKYDPSILTTPIIEVNTDYRYTCYYNKSLYAIAITANSVSVSKLDATMTILSDTWTIPYEKPTLQSGTIFNGVIYLSTVFGKFTVIDLVSHKSLSVDYINEPIEIEAFFDNDGVLCTIGHPMVGAGVFNICSFNGGISYSPMKVIEMDADNVTLTSSSFAPMSARSGFYHVVNGKTNGYLPSDDCVICWVDKNLICYSVADNGIWAYNGGWKPKGLFREISIPITFEGVSGSGALVLRRDLTLMVTSNNLNLTANDTIRRDFDFSKIYDFLGLADSRTFITYALSPTKNTQVGGDIYFMRILVTKTVVEFTLKKILNVDSGYNCNVRICEPLYY